MSKFKVGDKVRRVNPDDDHKFWNEPDDNMFHGRVYTVSYYNGNTEHIGFKECNEYYSPKYFELVESASIVKDSTLPTYTQSELDYIQELEDHIDMLQDLCSDYCRIIEELRNG